MEILKESTKSLCNVCYGEIDARVYVEGGSVFIEKHCPAHGKFVSLVEKDYKLYQLLSGCAINYHNSIDKLMLYVSSACNLNCNFCYEHSFKEMPEPSLSDIEYQLKGYRNKVVVICGREPTCREDLPEIIKLVKKRNVASLLTNGIKLSNEKYSSELKRAGLIGVVLSFNGLNDEIYKKINGRALLNLKLQALENIKKLRFFTVVSMTVARGINDDQIKDVYNYCLANRSFISELRLRCATSMGRYINIEPYCMSEFIDLVTGSLGVDKSSVMKEYVFFKNYYREFHKIFGKMFKLGLLGLMEYFPAGLCNIRFYIDLHRNEPIGNRIKPGWLRGSFLKKLILLPGYHMFRIYGIRYCIASFLRLFMTRVSIKVNLLSIELRCWPNIKTIDLEEIKKCTSGYYKDNKTLPFCYHNIKCAQQKIVS